VFSRTVQRCILCASHYLQLLVELATEAIKHGEVERAKVCIEAVQI